MTQTEWTWPTLQDVIAAKGRIRPHLARTPLHTYSPLNDLLGVETYIKHENYQPVGAFKVRGGINLVAQLSPDERARGLIGASTGNHGQSLSFALTAEHGYRYVHSGNEPHLIAGVGTHTLELLEDQPEIDTIIVPIGGGSGAAGACIVAKGINPAIHVIGVQSSASPAAYQSWREQRVAEAPNQTYAEGLATGKGFELPQQILWKYLDDFVLVSEEAIMQAVVWMVERAHALAEAAGAAPLAAAYHLRDTLQGHKLALICSGGNTSVEKLRRAIDHVESHPAHDS
jgi:threonine dehydratase